MSNLTHIKIFGPVREWFRNQFIEKKLNSFAGITIIIFFALLVGYSTALIDYRAGIGLVGVFLIIFIVILFIRFPYFGLYFVIIYSALPALLARIFMGSSIKIEFSLITDALSILLFLSVIIKPDLIKKESIGFWDNSITMTFVILFFFYIVEALNPNMHSFLGWLSFVRKFLIVFMTYYAVFCLLRSWKSIKFFIYFNIGFTTVLAMYSCKQQWFGVAEFEWRWATFDPTGFTMLLQGGLLRKWSTLSDPAASGMIFVSTALQCMILLVRQPEFKTKCWMAIALIFNLLGYSYSGTRTATMMLLTGIAFYGIATIYEKRTVIFLVVAIGAFAALMVLPISSPSIVRIKSTFDGTKDMSAAVRENDRHQIQPYLYRHPLGGGIFTSGMEGPKYNPGHPLMDFQPNSGYMKVLAEEGWVGLIILLITYYLIMSHALRKFYRAQKHELQNHSIALITLIFSLMVGQYSQFALVPCPQMFAYFGALAFFIKLQDFENI